MQSAAILEYLADKTGRFSGGSLDERLAAREWMFREFDRLTRGGADREPAGLRRTGRRSAGRKPFRGMRRLSVAGLVLRAATASDLEAIVRLHEADGASGHGYGDAWSEETSPLYELARRRIAESPDSLLCVAEVDGAVAGTFLLTIMPGLTGRGAVTALLRAVQVRPDLRSRRIGAAMLAFAEDEARARGATLLKLTSNKSRPDVHRFHARHGYAASHQGFSKHL
ncbi:GNAT family N-acetyltransferase [Chelatococcus sp. SYSU_G07232]|uniref:GNAT family N-acetyltransferase n=1 Tax=Chelatococcus albus TaxID=3047466 RepID=A0ABT7ACR9_9HYPH|nr:GNAT family N-acetyltransferase [Chelatococcus sp. SYSU_G07232]MDJ1157167.1 GNAT family N-acetyltransferase [Chelatococcus sp. SYSU_G07232]